MLNWGRMQTGRFLLEIYLERIIFTKFNSIQIEI